MGLAILLGRCWEGMAGPVPGFRLIPEENAVLVGTRDVGEKERENLALSGVTVVEPGPVRERVLPEALRYPLDVLRARVGKVYVHLDLDVLDPGLVAPANGFAPRGGLKAEEVGEAIREVSHRFTIAAAGIASYDPVTDEGGEVSRAAVALARELASPPAISRRP